MQQLVKPAITAGTAVTPAISGHVQTAPLQSVQIKAPEPMLSTPTKSFVAPTIKQPPAGFIPNYVSPQQPHTAPTPFLSQKRLLRAGDEHNYELSDHDDEDHEDDGKSKIIPAWAKSENLLLALRAQERLDPDSIFPPSAFMTIDLDGMCAPQFWNPLVSQVSCSPIFVVALFSAQNRHLPKFPTQERQVPAATRQLRTLDARPNDRRRGDVV